jgi:4-diphosphocytidyl-2-C-methyl-D-erythritol kinase
MVAFPPCKINLGLHILSKREDGYHNLETCFYPVGWTDALEVIPADAFEFSSSGVSIPSDGKDNLCICAYQLLKKDFNLPPVKIHLHKVIPTGAGLGGGSADAAYVLILLNEIFQLSLSKQTLSDYAARLGSDCAFFVFSKPMMGSGKGDVLTPSVVSLAGKFLVLVKPPVHVSTAEAYAGIKPQTPRKSLSEILNQPIETWRIDLRNDFEESVFKKFPVIQSVKEQLYQSGAVYASMSGSGAAVFGIFNETVELTSLFPDSEYWSGFMK